MPTLKCNKCGGVTNTGVSNYNLQDIEEGASCCYVRFENNRWVEGCAYNNAGPLFKEIADSLINKRRRNDQNTKINCSNRKEWRLGSPEV